VAIEDATPSAPPRVRKAVVLLWIALALAILESVVAPDFASFGDDGGFAWMFWTFVLLSYGLNAALIHFTSRRRNWARIALLLLTLASVAVVLFPWSDDYFAGWTVANVASTAAYTVMDLVALYWLFTGEAKEWFRRPAG
jgi:hypothetical protein